MCYDYLSAYKYMCHMHVWHPENPEEGSDLLELELQVVLILYMLETEAGSLQEQHVFWTAETPL